MKATNTQATSVKNIELTHMEQWMVKSNMESIKRGESPERIFAILRAGGYLRVAIGVERALKAIN